MVDIKDRQGTLPTMTCPDCEGHKTVAVSTPIKHPRDLDCNDWYVDTYPCETCGGTGVVPALECSECGMVLDATCMETAVGSMGSVLLCLDCRMREVC